VLEAVRALGQSSLARGLLEHFRAPSAERRALGQLPRGVVAELERGEPFRLFKSQSGEIYQPTPTLPPGSRAKTEFQREPGRYMLAVGGRQLMISSATYHALRSDLGERMARTAE
jgi:hypothetical protein